MTQVRIDELRATGQRFFDPDNPGPFAIDKSFYDRLREAGDRRRVASFVVPRRSGRAWEVQQGQLCRIVAIEGPQVGDLNVWNAHNARERLWVARSRVLNGLHATTYTRLWSTLPYFRPLLTVTDDTVPRSATGVRPHDLLGTGCDPYMTRFFDGADSERMDYTCRALLARAISAYHLKEEDVHDVVNLFQPVYIDPEPGDERTLVDASPARQGDYIEFFAEIDLLFGLATCQSGDFSVPGSQLYAAEHGDPLPTCKPLGVEIYEVSPQLLEGWRPPEPVALSWRYG